MTPTWGEFMTKLRALYKEYPTASKQYESDYDALAARLAEVTDILANGTGVSPDTHANRMHAALVVLNGTADSASVALCAKCGNNGDYGECSRCGRRLVGAGG